MSLLASTVTSKAPTAVQNTSQFCSQEFQEDYITTNTSWIQSIIGGIGGRHITIVRGNLKVEKM
jgi:hypothetical protein